MKKQLQLTALLCAGALAGTGIPAEKAAAASGRRELQFTDSAETLLNPGMGYTSTLWYRCKPGDTKVQNPTGALVLMFVDIGAFSSGENGGDDYPLDESFFAGMRGTLENCRNNGCTVAMRFRYDDDGTQNPEPATFDMLKQHIRQIDENGFLREYADILMYVESGFVGCYGEQWGGKYCSLEEKAELLDMLLDVVPEPIPVTVRTPNIFAKWAGIRQAELADWVSEKGSRAARVGLYDDGYMGSDSDLGTYADRAAETAWLGRQTLTSYFGGEFSGNLEYAQKFDTYLPENAIPEMYRTHLSYINSNIFALYDDYLFGEAYDIDGVNNTEYYGQTVRKFIRDHLGYRFVVRSADCTGQTGQGSTLHATLQIENTGFANPIREQKAELILEQGGNYLRAPLNLDSREWYSCTTQDISLTMQLPAGIPAGEWDIYLKLSVGDNTVPQVSMRSVRFANPDIWDPGIGANYIGTVHITENAETLCNNDFYQIGNPQHGDGTMYTLNGLQITDGAVSNAGEVSAALLAGENETGRLYLANDEQYFYIRACYDAEADAPVCNIQFRNPDTSGEEKPDYWLYYASNGFVYFNHGTPEGCLFRRGNGIAEFQIPLGSVMNLHLGTELPAVRFFLQDSANDWKLLSDVRSGAYMLKGDFPVYTACRTALLRTGGVLPLTVTDGAPAGSVYQWYKDGEAIGGATEQRYLVKAEDATAAGMYSVAITTPAGTVKTADICKVQMTDAGAEYDVNADGTVNAADAVLLAKYLTGQTAALPAPAAADTDKNGILTAADLSLLKNVLLEN